MEKLGGMMQCISSREGILYCVDVLRENTEAALDILADTLLNPIYAEDDINECKSVMEILPNELPAETLSRDLVQQAAYNNYPLGNKHYCPIEQIPNINKNLIENFRNEFFFGNNCVISGSGIEHDYFVKLIEEKFKNIPRGSDLTKKSRTKSEFVGGMCVHERSLKEPFIKIAIGFEVGGWHDSQFVATCVLQQLLGGGSSFSAGGPGKGMYTRLYTQVLNKHYWVESFESFSSLHDESGILGIDGACMPEYSTQMIRVIIDQLVRLAVEEVSDEELFRAKNMLRSMMMMQLESRLVICEDIARQFITFGNRELPHEVSEKIEKITKKDLLAVGQRLMNSAPAVGCIGEDLSKIPKYEEIKSFTEQYFAEARKKYGIKYN